jgi:hypothetical protein
MADLGVARARRASCSSAHILLHDVGTDGLNCYACFEPIRYGDRVLCCPTCKQDICPACVRHESVQQQVCTHAGGLQLTAAGDANASCDVCLAVVHPGGRILSCCTCYFNVCARCCEALGTAPLQQGPKKWLYGGCGHPPRMLEGLDRRDGAGVMCVSCNTRVATGSYYKFCNGCQCVVCVRCTKAMRRAAGSPAAVGSIADDGRRSGSWGASSSVGAPARGGSSTVQQPQQQRAYSQGGSGQQHTAANPLMPARLAADTKLEVFWVRVHSPVEPSCHACMVFFACLGGLVMAAHPVLCMP